MQPKTLVITLFPAIVMLVTGCLSNAYSRSQIDLIESFTVHKNPDWPYLDAEDKTSTICGPVTNCTQAVGNKYLTLLKFNTTEDAHTYATQLGTTAHQIDPLVIHFNGTPVPETTRQEIIKGISSMHADSPD